MHKIVVLVSGGGSNLQAIIDAIETKVLNCQIVSVIADRECYALKRAAIAGITTYLISRKVEQGNLSLAISKLIAKDCDLIVLAGFLSILGPELIKVWENKIINLHPSLLPKYGGKGMWGINVHRAVIANKEPESGCSVHFVTNEIDKGKILKQQRVPVHADDTIELLQQRVQQAESQVLIQAINELIS